jgi:hypothetical protein
MTEYNEFTVVDMVSQILDVPKSELEKRVCQDFNLIDRHAHYFAEYMHQVAGREYTFSHLDRTKNRKTKPEIVYKWLPHMVMRPATNSMCSDLKSIPMEKLALKKIQGHFESMGKFLSYHVFLKTPI